MLVDALDPPGEGEASVAGIGKRDSRCGDLEGKKQVNNSDQIEFRKSLLPCILDPWKMQQ